MLVERTLVAVGGGVAALEGIAAITFTEKAAGELRVRIARGLDRLRRLALGEIDAGGEEEADRAFAHVMEKSGASRAEIERRALEGMEQMDGATVVTIHGFSSELLRSHPVEAGVDPDFIVDDGQHAKGLREQVWEGFLARELGAEAPRPALWRRLLAELSLKEIGELARAMADFKIPLSLLKPPFQPPDARELFSAEVERQAREIGAMHEAQRGLPNMPLDYFTGVLRSLEAFQGAGLSAFHRRADSEGLANRLEKGRPKGPFKLLSGVSPDVVLELSKDSAELVQGLLRIDDESMLRLLEATAPFVIEFRESYLRRGFVSFDGLLTLARDLLRDHPAVRRQLKERFCLLFVDEFQDTDPVQYEIVLLLAEEPADDASAAYSARLRPGRLFAVGDAKQSVYRFRGADFAAYRRAVGRIVEAGGAPLDLITNFRSVPGILGPVNELFRDRDGAWRESAYQPGYVSIAPARAQQDDGPRVELWTVEPPAGSGAEERREAEGRALAAEIERLVERDRSCTYRQVTILFRALTTMSYYLRPLRERGIPFVVDGGRDFLRRPEVAQLMATLKTLAQPADEPALLAFLRSPAGGLSDVQLAEYARGGGKWNWRAAVDDKSFPAVARAYRMLGDLAEETRDLPADSAVRRVLERTHALPLGAAAFEGPQRVANMRKLVAAAGELARDGRLSLEQVVEALREGRLADIETDRPLADDAAEAVRITSIHRMKGLENDWIFVPDLAREGWRGRKNTRPVEVAQLPGGREALALSAGRLSSSAHAWLAGENEQHEQSEETRVLYVALTRARERLVLIAGPSRQAAAWVEALRPWGYEAAAPPEDGQRSDHGAELHRRPEVGSVRERPLPSIERDVSAAVGRYAEARDRLRHVAQPPIDSPSGLAEDRAELRSADSPERFLARDVAKSAGVVLHRLLEVAAGAPPDELRRRLGDLCRDTALEHGIDEAALRREAGEILGGFLDSPLARRLAEVEALGRELPILVRRDDGQVFHGSIDLLYRTAAGQIVVADYKTDQESDDDALSLRYRGQLAVYADAVRLALGLAQPPAAELWLLRSGRRVLLSGGSPPPAGQLALPF